MEIKNMYGRYIYKLKKGQKGRRTLEKNIDIFKTKGDHIIVYHKKTGQNITAKYEVREA